MAGGGVDIVDVEASIPTGGAKTFPLTSIEVPPGKRLLVNIQGNLTGSLPVRGEFRIGSKRSPFTTDAPGRYASGSFIIEESASLDLYRNNQYSPADFDGRVYTVELD